MPVAQVRRWTRKEKGQSSHSLDQWGMTGGSIHPIAFQPEGFFGGSRGFWSGPRRNHMSTRITTAGFRSISLLMIIMEKKKKKSDDGADLPPSHLVKKMDPGPSLTCQSGPGPFRNKMRSTCVCVSSSKLKPQRICHQAPRPTTIICQAAPSF